MRFSEDYDRCVFVVDRSHVGDHRLAAVCPVLLPASAGGVGARPSDDGAGPVIHSV